MELIEQLKEQLAELSVAVSEHPDGITVLAASKNGFDVSIYFQDGSYTVSVAQWPLDSFESSEASTALQLFAKCLSSDARLVVVSRGKRNVSWLLEENHAGTWRTVAHISQVLTQFWRPRQVRHLQNNLDLLGPNNSFKPTLLRGAA